MVAEQVKNPRSHFAWKITKIENNLFVGIAGMSVSNNRFKLGEIYYNIHPAHSGNGYATEVGKRLVSFGFDELKNIQATLKNVLL